MKNHKMLFILLLFSSTIPAIAQKSNSQVNTSNLNAIKSNIEIDKQVKFEHIIYSSIKGGDWYDPNTWVNGIIPDENDVVFITSQVIVSCNIYCYDLNIQESGYLNIGSGENKEIIVKVHNDLNLWGKLNINKSNQVNVKNRVNRKNTNPEGLMNYGVISIGNF